MSEFALPRRDFLRVGAGGVIGSALPLTLPSLRAANSGAGAGSGFGQAKSVLIVWLAGGLGQHDSLDPKPLAPAEIRGEFSPINTPLPGVSICEHLPLLAQQLQHWSIVRTLAHVEHNHLLATHVALTGRPTPIPRGQASDLDRVESRQDFPNYASALDYIRPRTDGVPTGVSLPNYFIEGALTWPGQYAGFLGPKHDPWQINQDPNDPNFKIDSLNLQAGVSQPRVLSRKSLLEHMNQNSPMNTSARVSGFGEQQEIAFSLLTSDKVANAFKIEQEPAEVRDRYGRNKFGQSLLLARRLVEAGVPVIQAAMGIVQTWDTHVDNWGRLKTDLLPRLDLGLNALMTDLSRSGLLDQTMVIVMGEFGRTPRIGKLSPDALPGRDHWASVYSALFAGAGIRGGQAIGQSDDIAAYPVTRSFSPADLCTTIFNGLGVGEDAMLFDPLNRPNHLLNGDVIEPLYSGRMA